MVEIEKHTGCDFCRELNGENNLYWEVAERYNLPRNRVIYEGKKWVIFPTVGAIVPGYVLIVPKIHHLSLMSCSRDEINELEYLLKQTRKILERVYNCPCIAFEHGSGDSVNNRPSSVDHCHLHILPLQEDIYNKIDIKEFQLEQIESLKSLLENRWKSSSYLLYQNHEEQFFLMHANTYISQYFRKLIALSEGVSEKWDWRTYCFDENIRTTLNDVNPELCKSIMDSSV